MNALKENKIDTNANIKKSIDGSEKLSLESEEFASYDKIASKLSMPMLMSRILFKQQSKALDLLLFPSLNSQKHLPSFISLARISTYSVTVLIPTMQLYG